MSVVSDLRVPVLIEPRLLDQTVVRADDGCDYLALVERGVRCKVSFFAAGEVGCGRFHAESWLERGYGNQSADGSFRLVEEGKVVGFDAAAGERVESLVRKALGLSELAAPGPRSRVSGLAG